VLPCERYHDRSARGRGASKTARGGDGGLLFAWERTRPPELAREQVDQLRPWQQIGSLTMKLPAGRAEFPHCGAAELPTAGVRLHDREFGGF
jgi:hypothetical protein